MEGMEFNKQQLTIINSQAKNLLVMAGPGTGKTTVIVERICRLIREGASPYEFLVITFTRKAAQQLRERLEKALAGTDVNVKKMTICTSHAFCLHIIQQWGEKIGYDENLVIYDEIDQKDIITAIIKDLGYKCSPAETIRAIKNIDLKNKDIYHIYNVYLQQLKSYNALDYDLILKYAVYILQTFPEALQYYQNRYKYLFYDEFQDIASLENDLCLTIVIENSFVVGDADQNIYHFRGTDNKYLLEYQNVHSDCEILKLEYNYRSRPEICTAANNLISYNTQRSDTKIIATRKSHIFNNCIFPFIEENEEGMLKDIVYVIKFSLQVKPQDIAILVRTNRQIEPIKKVLESNDIPVQVVTRDVFWQKPEIKDMLAFMRVILNPKDNFSINRILKMPFLKLTRKQILEIKHEAIVMDKSLFEACQNKIDIPNSILQPFFDMSLITPNPLAIEVYKTIIDNFGYIDYLKTQNLTSRVESVLSMKSKIIENESLKEFLERISLIASIDSWDETKEAISLMTLHCAKGLEWDTVFIPGCVESLTPLPCQDDMAMEEERRLFYVGITRAKERLYLGWSDIIESYGKIKEVQKSRFLEEAGKHTSLSPMQN